MDLALLSIFCLQESLNINLLLGASFPYPDHQENSQALEEITLAEQRFLMEVKFKREIQREAWSGNRNEDRLPRKSCLQ